MRARAAGRMREVGGGCGCTEPASDCELDNDESLAFHLSAGFSEANRVICFAKRLARP